MTSDDPVAATEHAARMARVRLLYTLPAATPKPSLLIVGPHDAGWAADWPGTVSRSPVAAQAGAAALPGPQTYDVITLPGLLGRAGSGEDTTMTLLRRWADALAPGGVLVGDVPLRRSLHLASLGARQWHARLAAAGLSNVECYFVQPSADDPVTLIPAERRAAAAYFTRQLTRARAHHSLIGYLVRRAAIALGFGALNQRSLLFWARRPC